MDWLVAFVIKLLGKKASDSIVVSVAFVDICGENLIHICITIQRLPATTAIMRLGSAFVASGVSILCSVLCRSTPLLFE